MTYILQDYCAALKIDACFCNKNVTGLFYSERSESNLQENTHERTGHTRDNRFSRFSSFARPLGQPDGHRRI